MLNPPQQEAVDTLQGPLLVLAGAGTGKTRVVTYRIAKLIRHGTPPDRILAVTFTNKAANEMRERVGQLLSKKSKQKPFISTFHSLCVQMLRRHIQLLGYPKNFVIYDRGEQERVAKAVLRQLKMTTATLKPADLLWQVGQWKTRSIRPNAASQEASSDKEHLAAAGYRRYQKSLFLAGAVDFDDLLLLTERLFDECPEARSEEAALYDHILVDEYQDTNGTQYKVVRGLAEQHRNLCVVGDDDQAIYAWRGAEVRHILRFRRDWPDAKVVRLQDNYRSTEQILQVANRLIRHNKQRHDKRLIAARQGGDRPRIDYFPDEIAEAREVVRQIRNRIDRGASPEDCAILFRTNEQPRLFETELREAGLPYNLIGSRSFYDRKEVRDVLAFLRVVARPNDDLAMVRILNVPPRGISEKSIATLRKHAEQTGQSIWRTLGHAAEVDTINPKACAAMAKFREDVTGLAQRAHEIPPTELVHELLQTVNYERELDRQYEDPEQRAARRASVEEIVNSASAYEEVQGKPSLYGWIDQLALTASDFDHSKESQLKRPSVVLMTLHAAKGLEFPHVYMVGMEEGLLPHKHSVLEEKIDEERRLCYVGVTRAQETLTLTLAKTRRKWGKPRETHPSRFLFEIIGKAAQAS